ncbi:1787_t:CDS:1, partial [Entrophospora sp. SA101]
NKHDTYNSSSGSRVDDYAKDIEFFQYSKQILDISTPQLPTVLERERYD